MPSLTEYFQSPALYEQALKRYASFASRRGWGIAHKLAMYNWAKAAFDSDLPDDEKRREFQNIYDNLKSNWQIFRGVPAGWYWSASKTYEALAHNSPILSRQSGMTLRTLRPDTEEAKGVLADLSKLRNLKQTQYYPWMPVAKFTHFLNPMLFPIYDKTVVWDMVLNDVFRSDYLRWCEEIDVEPLESDTESAQFNLTYTLMAANVIQNADPNFMDNFAKWFKERVTGKDDDQNVLREIDKYYATAFEFVAIGSALL